MRISSIIIRRNHNKYNEFLPVESYDGSASGEGGNDIDFYNDISHAAVCSILATHFKKGFSLNSFIEQRRFMNLYCETTNEDLPNSVNIDDLIRRCGLVCDGRVFAPEAMLPVNLRQKIHDFVFDVFADGQDYIFYEYIYQQFRDELFGTEIVDTSRLRICLQHYYCRDWLFTADYITKNKDVVVNINNIVVEYVKECGRVVKEDEVVKALHHLPEAKVRSAFQTNRNVFIAATRKSKFHIDLLEVTQEELDKICYIIDNAIAKFSFISSEELLAEIKNVIPTLIENNSAIPSLGIFNALSVMLATRYSFNTTIICLLGHKLYPEDILCGFAHRHKEFTIKEISDLARKLNASIDYHLKNMYRYAIRINNDTFVAKDSITFDVTAVDIAIDKCLENKHAFLPLSKITNFISFPIMMEYTWNQRLLESYLVICSNSRYAMLYSGYMRGGSICGVIVNKSRCEGWEFDDILVQALAESGLSLKNSREALDFCAKEGYIINRRLKGIDAFMDKARKVREDRTNK